MRGRKPDPAGVRSQKSAVRSRRAKDEPPPPGPAKAGAAPGWLKGAGLEIWGRLAPALSAAKLLTAADCETFGRYCRNFARWLKLNDELDAEGETYVSESAHGTLKRSNPALLQAMAIERQLLAIEDRFGLNPAERQRIFAQRSQTGISGDLFAEAPKRPDDAATRAAQAEQPAASPIGFLH